MVKILLAAALLFAMPARAGILDAVFSKPKAEAVNPAAYAGITHLIIVGGDTDYKLAQEELLARIEAGLREADCWRLMEHATAGRLRHDALKAPSPIDWDDEAQVSSVLLENMPHRDERLGIMVFWVRQWRGEAFSGRGDYERDAVAQVFDSATGDQVWRAHMFLPPDGAGADSRLPAADKARREDRALSEYNLFASFFVDNLRHPSNMESNCRPRVEAPATVSAKAREVVDPVARAVAQLKSSSAAVRAQAAETLGQTQDDAALAPLLQALSDGDVKVRAYALDALGELGNASAVDAVAGKLTDPNKLLRALAARALGRIGSLRAVPALEKLLGAEKDPLVRKVAESSLRRIVPDEGVMGGPLDRVVRP